MRRFVLLNIVVSFGLFTACGGCTDGKDPDRCPTGTIKNPVSGVCEAGGDAGINNGQDGGANNTPFIEPWADDDNDGFLDRFDNCVDLFNPGQEDSDLDAIGDPCDNCPDTPNFDQADEDGDGVGDFCEDGQGYDPTQDSDGDGVPDIIDNCRDVMNPGQEDNDMDSLGNDCDNCPDAANIDQTDTTGDGTGDACSPIPVGMICGEQTSDFELLQPNILLLLDTSGSMGGSGITGAKQGLDALADTTNMDARFAFANYPVGGTCGVNTAGLLLPMGSYNAAQMRASWAPVGTGGGTPTGGALQHALNGGLLNDAADPQNDIRPKAVVLITDGNPNDCGGQTNSVTQAGALFAAGIPVYVIGYAFGGSAGNLDQMAEAGGTDAPPAGGDNHYTAANAAALTQVIQNIARNSIACQYTLNPAPPDANKIWVEIDGNPTAREPTNGFTYDEAANVLTINGNACQQLRMLNPNGQNDPLKISFGCATPCEPTAEVCNFVDDDCNGFIDDGITCDTEICDGIDNDGDGEVDEGCPDCTFDVDICDPNRPDGAGACGGDSECCNNSCGTQVGGDSFCGPACHPTNVACRCDTECCSGTCAIASGDDVGTCIVL